MLREEELLAIITEQHETIQRLENRISELEEQLHKDSHNSSKPPSSDGYEKPSPKSQRKKSGKKAGGQTGHKGHHMALERPDRIEKVYPVLLSMCRAADFYNQHPEIGSRQHYMDCLKQNYDRILEEAVKQNPLPEKQVNRRGKPKKGKIRALIDRLIQYKGEVCRFADNLLVPFSNNQAERDLRMVKMKNKVIGSFRSVAGAADFLTLKSFTSTAAKTGQTAFSALLDLFQGDFACGTE